MLQGSPMALELAGREEQIVQVTEDWHWGEFRALAVLAIR